MGTPKKPVKKPAAKNTGTKKPDPSADPQAKKKIIDDDDDDEDFDIPLEELGGGYDSLEGYEDDDDY